MSLRAHLLCIIVFGITGAHLCSKGRTLLPSKINTLKQKEGFVHLQNKISLYKIIPLSRRKTLVILCIFQSYFINTLVGCCSLLLSTKLVKTTLNICTDYPTSTLWLSCPKVFLTSWSPFLQLLTCIVSKYFPTALWSIKDQKEYPYLQV